MNLTLKLRKNFLDIKFIILNCSYEDIFLFFVFDVVAVVADVTVVVVVVVVVRDVVLYCTIKHITMIIRADSEKSSYAAVQVP